MTVDDYSQGVDPDTVKDSMAKLVHRMPAMADGYFRGGWSGLFTITPTGIPSLTGFRASTDYSAPSASAVTASSSAQSSANSWPK